MEAAILRKIRACLRLAASSNAHEAAAALRQAQALMQKHGVSQADIDGVNVHHSTATTRSRGRDPAPHIRQLALLIANAFRCLAIVVTLDGDTSIRFVGYATSPIVATYAFVTLRRQMERDAARHLFQIRIASTRRRRRETYGYGWVSGLASHFTPDTLSPSDHKLFAHHSGFAEHLTCVSHDPTAHLNELSETNIRDYFYGMQGGTRARYRPGVNTHRRAHHAAMAFESNRYV